MEDSIAAIENYISSEWDGGNAEIELVAEVVEPRGSEEDLEQITDMMGSYTTNYKDSGQNRCDNISNATSKINGTLLYPGEEFSVYEADRTAGCGKRIRTGRCLREWSDG